MQGFLFCIRRGGFYIRPFLLREHMECSPTSKAVQFVKNPGVLFTFRRFYGII